MATQGVLSILVDGNVSVKVITGTDGYKIPEIAEDVVKKGIYDAQGLFDLCRCHGLGGESLVVQYSPSEWIGGQFDDDLPKLYSEKFSDPRFNPRWSCGIASYVEVVNAVPNVEFNCDVKSRSEA